MDSPHIPTGKRKPSDSFIGISMGILFLFTLFIAIFLAYYSIRYSYYSTTNYGIPVQLRADKLGWNLLCFALAVLLCYPLERLLALLGSRKRLGSYVFLGLCCLAYGILSLIWVQTLPYYPSGDQLNATAAAHYHLNGNFIMLKNTGYLGKFPYQKGLTFYYEILFSLFGHFCYLAAARIHILYGILTIVFGYLFVEGTASRDICKLLYCPLMVFCIPYLILTPYTYGDLPSICFGTILCWAMLRYSHTLQKRYVILGCIMAVFSLWMRMHSWILLIAAFIGMLLVTVQKKKIAPLIVALLMAASAFFSVKLLDYSYYLRSGYAITAGAPMILTLAMGMQDNEGGPGTYNNYQTSTMSEVDFDAVAASEIARENLRENLTHFREDPAYAKWFFKTKLLMQWTEPTFETLISTRSFDDEKELPAWIERIYYGDLHDRVTVFADRYQSIVYLGFACFLPVLWKKRRENAAAWIPLIAIVGGFLFSIIWEAQCRYVLPYYMWMLLYVPEGICFVSQGIRWAYRYLTARTGRHLPVS